MTFPSAPLVEIKDLTVEFAGRDSAAMRALDGVSLEIREGEFVGVLGESGSGKSTLASSVLGLFPANARVVAGSVTYRGQSILTGDTKQLNQIRGSQITMIFQHPGMALNPFMRAARQVAEVIHAHNNWPWRRCKEEARRTLEKVFDADFDRICQAFPHQLSGGEKQRLSIAQAIACNPSLIIADEPTSSLDVVVQVRILQLFKQFRELNPASVIFLTHDPGILASLADRVIVLRQGRIVEQGEAQAVLGRPRESYTAGLVGSYAWA